MCVGADLAVKAFPMWFAPNLITLSGFGFIALKCVANHLHIRAFIDHLERSIIALSLYVPDLSGPGPSWLYLSFAMGLFLYQTFDSAFYIIS